MGPCLNSTVLQSHSSLVCKSLRRLPRSSFPVCTIFSFPEIEPRKSSALARRPNVYCSILEVKKPLGSGDARRRRHFGGLSSVLSKGRQSDSLHTLQRERELKAFSYTPGRFSLLEVLFHSARFDFPLSLSFSLCIYMDQFRGCSSYIKARMFDPRTGSFTPPHTWPIPLVC